VWAPVCKLHRRTESRGRRSSIFLAGRSGARVSCHDKGCQSTECTSQENRKTRCELGLHSRDAFWLFERQALERLGVIQKRLLCLCQGPRFCEVALKQDRGLGAGKCPRVLEIYPGVTVSASRRSSSEMMHTPDSNWALSDSSSSLGDAALFESLPSDIWRDHDRIRVNRRTFDSCEPMSGKGR
jgi:hypothetical protein